MTNWEKLRAGMVYDDFSDELYVKRGEAKKLFKAYNATDDADMEQRQRILSDLFASVGEKVTVESDFKCEFGKNISVGSHTYINFGCVILDCAEVSIGEHVLIGPNLGIYAVNHGFDPQERIAGACYGKPVRIEDNVWIGGSVTILGGVTIGEGSIIGAGSVVTHSVPPRVIAAGNPCRVIRPITDEDKLGFVK